MHRLKSLHNNMDMTMTRRAAMRLCERQQAIQDPLWDIVFVL
jgi:hypothetical protein